MLLGRSKMTFEIATSVYDNKHCRHAVKYCNPSTFAHGVLSR